jgi:putative transcriptional regulator
MNTQRPLTNSVRRHRQLASLTQQQLAEKLGVTRQTVLAMEKGNYTPSVSLALALAEVFGTRVEDIFHLHNGESQQ